MNQIEERHAKPAVALGVADDEPEIAFDHPAQSRLVAIALDAARKLPFFLGRETWNPGNGAEVRLQCVGVV